MSPRTSSRGVAWRPGLRIPAAAGSESLTVADLNPKDAGRRVICPSPAAWRRARPEVLRGVRDAAGCGRARTAGSPNHPDAKFCGECGTPLGAAAAVPRAAGGHRHASGWRPCCAGRRAAAGDRPVRRPRRLHARSPRGATRRRSRELLTRYFDLAREVIDALRRHGREVHRRRGDGRLGRARSPARTTPSAPSAPRWSWSTRSGRWVRGSRRAPAC